MLGKGFKVVLTTAAKNDILEAYTHYKTLSEIAAENFIKNTFSRLDLLEEFWAFEELKDGVRRVGINRFPYFIYFKIETDTSSIRVVAIKHERRGQAPGL